MLSGKPWTAVLDTALDDPCALRAVNAEQGYPLQGRSLVLLQELAL
jgi:hypothetical protein